MSEKYILFADFHIHNHGQDWQRVDDALEVLGWIRREAKARGIKTVFFLGDFYHIRGYIYPSIHAKAYAELNKFKQDGIELNMLIGNHDMPYKRTTKHNSMTSFKPIANIVEQPMVWDEDPEWDFYMLPYVDDPDQLHWAIDKICTHRENSDANKKSVLLAHLDIKDALYHSDVTSTHGIEPGSITDKFDMIITGHYHINQKINKNIYYVGSPYQQNFGEANQRKGFYIFENGELDFIENTFSPKYLYVGEEDLDDGLKDNYVKIIASKDSNVSTLKDIAFQQGPRNVTIKIDAQTNSSIGGVKQVSMDSKDISVMLKEWVESNANSEIYDKKKLLQYGKNIIAKLGDVA